MKAVFGLGLIAVASSVKLQGVDPLYNLKMGTTLPSFGGKILPVQQPQVIPQQPLMYYQQPQLVQPQPQFIPQQQPQFIVQQPQVLAQQQPILIAQPQQQPLLIQQQPQIIPQQQPILIPQPQPLVMQQPIMNQMQYLPSFGMMPQPSIDYSSITSAQIGPTNMDIKGVATNSQFINASSTASGHSNANTNSDNTAYSTNYGTTTTSS